MANQAAVNQIVGQAIALQQVQLNNFRADPQLAVDGNLQLSDMERKVRNKIMARSQLLQNSAVADLKLPDDLLTIPIPESTSNFADSVKSVFTKYITNDTFKSTVESMKNNFNIGRVVSNTLAGVSIMAVHYCKSNWKLLVDETKQLPVRIGQFLAGLVVVVGFTSIKAALLYGAIEGISAVLKTNYDSLFATLGTITDMAISSVGAIFGSLLTVVYHTVELCRRQITVKQWAESMLIDVMQSVINVAITSFLTSTTGPIGIALGTTGPIGIALGCAASLIIGYYLGTLEAQRKSIPDSYMLKFLWNDIKSIFTSSMSDCPDEMRCPISYELMKEPVVLHGIYFDKKPLVQWLRQNNTHPLTRADAFESEVTSCSRMKKLINEYSYFVK